MSSVLTTTIPIVVCVATRSKVGIAIAAGMIHSGGDP